MKHVFTKSSRMAKIILGIWNILQTLEMNRIFISAFLSLQIHLLLLYFKSNIFKSLNSTFNSVLKKPTKQK